MDRLFDSPTDAGTIDAVLSGGLHLAGFDTGVISSRRTV